MKRLIVILLTLPLCVWAIDSAAQTADKEPRIDESRLGGRAPAARIRK